MRNRSSRTSSSSTDPRTGKYAFSALLGTCVLWVSVAGIGSMIAGASIDAEAWWMWFGVLLGSVLTFAAVGMLVLLFICRSWFRPPFAKP